MNRKFKKLEISDIAILVAISVLVLIVWPPNYTTRAISFLTVFLLCCFFFYWNPVLHAVTLF